MKKRNLLLSIFSGLILACAMPKPGAWFLAWVAFIPLFVALRSSSSKEAALYGFTAGVTYFGITLFWITLFGYLPWIALAAIEALFIAVFTLLASRLLPGRTGWLGYLAVPSVWTSIQWIRSLGTFSFTWGSLAHTQANNLAFAQMASVTGSWGMDFLICLFNLAFADLLFPLVNKRRCVPAVIAAILTTAVYFSGYAAMHNGHNTSRNVKVAIIQGNVPQDVIPDLNYMEATSRTYAQMSLEAAKNKPDFIIWPETTLPVSITNSGWDYVLSNLAKATDSNLVVGAYDASDDPAVSQCHNAAHLYGKSGEKLGVYRKVRLVPYGEFVPFRDKMPFLQRYGIREQDVLPGKSHVLIDTEIGKVGLSICFESLFPQISREETRNGAAALFIITNDAWFKKTQAAEQHLMMAKLRAIENRRFVVRAAATGISAVLDPYGRTSGELGIFKKGIISGRIAPLHTLSPYARFGDYFAYICVLISAISLLIALFSHNQCALPEKLNQEIEQQKVH